uniref:Uncharacterized protein n=1 Tax=Arundo donax TaxID=35708 RepID=A0A0A8YD50_ARUDO
MPISSRQTSLSFVASQTSRLDEFEAYVLLCLYLPLLTPLKTNQRYLHYFGGR